MTTIVQRVSIIFIALLFFGFASALSIFVIYQAIQSNKANKQAEQSSQAAKPEDSQNKEKLANFTPVADVPELKSTDSKVGDGAEIVNADQTIVADYSGAVAATGVIFDTSKGKEPLNSKLSNLIPGWKTGMLGMKVGGERRMLIPADQAYGASPPQGSGIPANAPLVFDVTLKDVK